MRRAGATLVLLAVGACAATPPAADLPPSSTGAPPLAAPHPLDLHRTVEARGRYGVSFALPARTEVDVRFNASTPLRERSYNHPDSDVVERGGSLDVLCPGHRVGDCTQVGDTNDGTFQHFVRSAGDVARYVSFVWENPSDEPAALDVHFELPKGARVFSDIPRED